MGVLDSVCEEACLKLYHISFDIDERIKVFTPRIPDTAGVGEDKTIKRICLADSVEHCLQAISPAQRDVEVGSLFYLYEFSIPRNNLICLEELYAKNLVPDATENNEFWCTKDLYPTDCKLCRIKDFSYEFCIQFEPLDFEEVQRLIEKYVPEFVYEGNSRHSKDIYCSAMRFINEKEDSYEVGSEEQIEWCEKEDSLYEAIVELPWAQGVKISDVVYEEVS